ncbi:NAD-dependent epimerase/dehydratase family protein [Salarchaeum sp. III]|uniref:NAD-dependent epimerase/dehydratase family protein n=1 Tax=Salarchaeum sp. III TaxID=3107927 RepID=UPI002ED985DB
MNSALVVGGTRFIGRHTVEELLEHEYHVTLFNRGSHENPFVDYADVHHVRGDRGNDEELLSAKREVEPDVVFDFAAYHPEEVRSAVEIFADVDAYVYVSSGAAYARDDIPKREAETPIKECTPDQAVDDSYDTYGNRKAEGDRAVFEAADRGVNAMSVRPTVVYGPFDYTERLDYWVNRVENHDRVVVPGDGTNVWQRVYVEDVANLLRLVAENGTPGNAYNAGDQNSITLERTIEEIESALDTDVEVVHASERELSTVDLDLADFPLYRPYPHVLDTHRAESVGWESTPVSEAMERTVGESTESDRDGADVGPARETEERLLDVLDTV